MKSCPKCKRTYADDSFTFCLEDGALLSAPYQPEEQKSSGGIRSSEPPPTVRAVRASGQTSEEENRTLQPTIAAPAPPLPAEHMKASVSPQTELPVSPPRTSTMLRADFGGFGYGRVWYRLLFSSPIPMS